jgi:hypothetical protein
MTSDQDERGGRSQHQPCAKKDEHVAAKVERIPRKGVRAREGLLEVLEKSLLS